MSLAVGKTSVFLIEQLNQSIRIIDILSNNEPVYITGQIAGSVGAAIYTDETLVLNDSTTGMLTIINTQGGQTKLIKDVPVCAIACIENSSWNMRWKQKCDCCEICFNGLSVGKPSKTVTDGVPSK